MDDDYDRKPYEDDSREYRERSPHGENGGGRARSASPGGRDRDSRPPVSAPAEDEEEAQNSGTNLFVTGIHPKLSEEDVQRLFEKYGEVEKCNIMRDPHTRDSRGFGFVNMMSAHEADAAKEGLQGEVYEGRTLSIERARRSKPRHPTPGKYFGPPKREDFGGRRPPPRGGFGGDRYGGGGYRGYGRRDEPYGGRGRYEGGRDDRYASSYPPRRDRYDDRPPRDDRYSSRGGSGGRDYDSRGPPPAAAGGRYEGGGAGGYEDRADDRYSRR